MKMLTDGVHCQETAGAVLVVVTVVPVTGTAFFGGITMDQLMCASLVPHPLLAQQWTYICDAKTTALKAEVWVDTVMEGRRRFMAMWRKEEEDAARRHQEKREATRLGKLLSHMEA